MNKKIIVLFVLLLTASADFAQKMEDCPQVQQKVFFQSNNWKWDPVWGLNYNQTLGKTKMKDEIIDFFKRKMTVQVKNNSGELLFITHREPINANTFWLFSGFKWKKANQYDPADDVVPDNKKTFIDNLNLWISPFDFRVELADNAQISYMVHKNFIHYYDYGIWVIMYPNQMAACKKAVTKGFSEIVRVTNKMLVDYHPYSDLIKKYVAKQEKEEKTPNAFDQGDLDIFNVDVSVPTSTTVK